MENEPCFLQLMSSGRKRSMAKLMIDDRNWESLDSLIENEESLVKQAYSEWKAGSMSLRKDYEDFEIIGEVDGTEEQDTIQSHFNGPLQTGPFDNIQSLSLLSMTLEGPTDPVPTLEHSNSPKVDDQTLREPETIDSQSTSDASTEYSEHIPSTLFDILPEIMTIVLLSETGSGKSTFINALVNYLTYSSFDEAMKEGVEVLIRTFFNYVDAENESTPVDCFPTVEPERSLTDSIENEDIVAGNSSTQFPKSYLIPIGPPESKKFLRIIDTPGVGDTRGVDQEKQNFQHILNHLSLFPEINAICILLKPNESRLTVMFRYCINELLRHLHVSAAKNILFCFTSISGTGYRPGESKATLDKHLGTLKKEGNIEITTKDSTFCFDNNCYRFLCAHSKGLPYTEDEIKCFRTSWDFSSKQAFKLIEKVATLDPHDVKETLSVNNIRYVVSALSRPLAEIAKNQMVNKELIENKLKEVNTIIQKKGDLRGRLFVDQIKLVAQELPYPVTVCTSKSCVEYKSLSNEPNAPMETIYKTVCHAKCYLEGVETSVVPNVALQKCFAFHQNIEQCRVCGCSWSLHMHIRYRLQSVLEKTKDVTVERNIADYDDQKREADAFIANQERERDQLEKESAIISRSCVAFATFVKNYSLVPCNDAYKDYLEYLIKEEENKNGDNKDKTLLELLRNYQKEYDMEVQLLQKASDKEMNTTTEEIYAMVETLKELPKCGQLLKEIQNLDLLSDKDQVNHYDVIPDKKKKKGIKSLFYKVKNITKRH